MPTQFIMTNRVPADERLYIPESELCQVWQNVHSKDRMIRLVAISFLTGVVMTQSKRVQFNAALMLLDIARIIDDELTEKVHAKIAL